MGVARCCFCNSPVPSGEVLLPVMDRQCRSCGRAGRILTLPALLRGGMAPPPLADPPGEGEAVCFYDPTRRATTTCGHCGVLMSSAWAARWGSQTLCLKCLDHLRQQRGNEFERGRTLWDNIVLLLVVGMPLLACVFAGTIVLLGFAFIVALLCVVSVPTGVFLGFWHWNSPRSVIPRGRARLIIGVVSGLVLIGAAILALTGWWMGWFK